MIKATAIYERKGVYLFHSQSKTTAGVWLATEPFLRLETNCSSDDRAVAALKALASSKESIPHPMPPVSRFQPMYELAKVKSWGQFIKGSRLVSIRMDRDKMLVKPYRNKGGKEGFQETGQPVELSLPVTNEQLGQAIDDAFQRCS